MGALSDDLAAYADAENKALVAFFDELNFGEIVAFLSAYREDFDMATGQIKSSFSAKPIIERWIQQGLAPEKIISACKESPNTLEALYSIIQESLVSKKSSMPQGLKDLVLRDLLSNTNTPKKRPGRPKKSDRNRAIIHMIERFSNAPNLKKGTGENSGQDHTLVEALSQVFDTSEEVIRDVWKYRPK